MALVDISIVNSSLPTIQVLTSLRRPSVTDMKIDREDNAFNRSETPEEIAKRVKEALSKFAIEEIEQLLREIEAHLAARP